MEPSDSFLGGLFAEGHGRRQRSSSVEQGRTTRAQRSPSVEITESGMGLGTDRVESEDRASKRTRIEGSELKSAIMAMAKDLFLPVMQLQSSSMTELGGQMVSAVNTMRGTSKVEKEGKPEEPILVKVGDFSEEQDDAVNQFAHGIRNSLRPFCCPPKDYWGGVSR